MTRPGEPTDPTDPADRPDPEGWAVLDIPLDSPPPSEISTEEDDPPIDPAASGGTPQGPPGGRIFSLEGRPAAGLYLVAWLFSLGGVGVLFMTGLAGAGGVPPVVAIVALALLGLGFATGAGYQVVARSARPTYAYRGPSPALLFGVVLVVVPLAVGLSLVGLNASTDNSVAFISNLLALAGAYALVVWLFVVRTGAMRWREMGWPIGRPLDKLLSDLLVGMGVTVPALFAILAVAVVVSMLLGGIQAPEILPVSRSTFDVVLLAVATILVAPIGEELFFRGFALTAWWRDLGPRSAIIRSAVFFGIVHILTIETAEFSVGLRQVILVLVQIIPLGVVLGWLFVRRGIAAAIGGHVIYNTFIFFALMAAPNLPQG